MHLNLVRIHPENNLHPNFEEVRLLYAAHLHDLGHTVHLGENRLHPQMLNLIFGFHFLPPQPEDYHQNRFKYIVLQFEQLGQGGGWYRDGSWFKRSLPALRNALQVWDYDPANITVLASAGVPARLMPLGYHPDLLCFRQAAHKDVDVLFYGEGTARRMRLIEELDQHCKVKFLYGCYGAERDAWIARSKIILNLHYSDQLALLEQVRLFYLLSHGCFVLSEESHWNPYAGGIVTYPYEQIVSGVLEWLKKGPAARQQIAAIGFAKLVEMPMQQYLKTALADLADIEV